MKSGFTLIELSIVLVIIGLIAGGILTGRDLVRAAEIRATLSQLEKYNTAVHTFQNKYGYLPGDIPGSVAATFGFYNITGSLMNTTVCGDGNGLIQGLTGAWLDSGAFENEIAMFWLHLSQANLIDGMYGAGGAPTIIGATPTGGSISGTYAVLSANATGAQVSELIPPAKLGSGNYVTVAQASGINYFIITGINELDTSGRVFATNNISPIDAYAIDQKIDDSKPATGRIFALDTVTEWVNWSNGAGVTTPNANNCVNGSGSYYISSSTYKNTLNCSLRFNFQ